MDLKNSLKRNRRDNSRKHSLINWRKHGKKRMLFKHRYLVVFSMGNQVFAKRYNSIRELKCDTGKRPSQIQRCTKDMTCESLTQQHSSAAQ